MTKSPLINALSAAGYIIAVASFIYFAPQLISANHFVLIPIAMLSLFVLSAIVMGLCFLYKPVLLYLDGNKTDATALFLQTVSIFALLTIGLIALLILLSAMFTRNLQ